MDVIAPLLTYDGMHKGVSREEIIKRHYEVRYKMLSPETLKREIIPQLEVVGLILQEPDPDDKRRLLIYPTVSTPIISAKLAEDEGESSNNHKRDRGEHCGVEGSSTTSTTTPTNDILEVIKAAMGDKDYFILDEWKTRLMCLPVQDPLHCDEDQAEQTLYQLVQEGKIVEFEQGKYDLPPD